MAELSHYTMKTLAAAAGGLNLPTLPVTAAYVRACDGNVAEWEDRWHRVADALKPGQDGGTPKPDRAADGAGPASSSDGTAAAQPADDGSDDGARRGAAARERAAQRTPRPSQVASPRPAREGPSGPDPTPPPPQRPDQVYVITSAAPKRPNR
jgi:hypothetical protein